MKKILVILLALILVLAFAGCKNADDGSEGNANGGSGTEATTGNEPEEVAKGSEEPADIDFSEYDTGGMTLDDVNAIEEYDPEVSFRTEERVSIEDMESTSSGQD